MYTNRGWIMKRTALSFNKTALIDVHTGESWTYATLEHRILRWASLFSQNKYEIGERIAVLSPNNPELFAIMFACEMKGLIYVPLNWRLSLFELTMLIEDCEPATLIYHEQFASNVQQMKVLNPTSLTAVESIQLQASRCEMIEAAEEDPWMMIYTGGTTGLSKGVVLSYDAVNWNALNTITSWGLSDADITVNYMPLFHTGGINALSIPILMAGGQVVIGNVFDAEEALTTSNTYGATISLFVPTMYQAMVNTPYFQQATFPTMKVFLSGGAPCPLSIYHRFFDKGLNFKEGYGLTEAGPNNFYMEIERARVKIGSVGKSMLFNDVKVVKNDGTLCSVSEVGELYIKGRHVFSSYWRKPRDTMNTLVDGWLRTGDLAKVDNEGDYYIVGRKKDIIISGGENVYPQEVEQCLIRFKGIAEAAVIGKKDAVWGEVVTAFITVTDGHTFNEKHMIQHCRNFLGGYKIPKEVIVLPNLPKTDVGKIDHNALHGLMYMRDK